MGDIALKGPELKKMVAMAKKRDLNFAYCPGNDPKEDVFVLDRKKKPEVMGRVARAEGTGTKLGFGTAKVKGKVMSLTCERELPQLAKKLKKFLKSETINMNIIVLDMSGQVLEEDIEDLGEDEDDEDVFVDDGDDDDDDGSQGQETAEEGGSDVIADDDAALLKSLKARAAEIQGGIKAASPEAQAKLIPVFKVAVGAMQSGDLAKADDTFTKLDAALDKMAGAGVAQDASADTNDPALARLAEVSATLLKRIEDLGNSETAPKLRAAHGILDGQIEAGDAKKAAGTAKALGDAITRAAEAAQTAPEDAKAEDAKEEPAVDPSVAYRDARAELEPLALDLIQRGLGDVGKMRGVLAYFIEKGDAEDYAGAMKAVPGLKKLIADAENAEKTEAEKDIPANVVPFVRARLEWIKTRATLKSELTKLQGEILAVCQGDDFPDISSESQALFSYLDVLDNRLEDALEALVQAPDGEQREKLKDNARKVLSEYQKELDTPFFQAVDSNNGFKPVNVRGAAVASLGKVNEALSAAA